jgi:hypothetical protein
MTGIQSLELRVALAASVSAACTIAISSRVLFDKPREVFDRLAIWGLAASRLGLYVVVFLILKIQPRGDVPHVYTDEAFATLHGQHVYRDFLSSYAPLHSYLDASLFRLWPNPLALMLFAVVCECFLLPVWLPAARAFISERHVRMATLLYIFSPISIQYVAVDGQDNVVAALLLALAVLLLVRNRALLSGLSTGVAIAVFKFLPLVYVPSFILAAYKRRWNWVAGIAIPTLLVYGGFALIHSPILVPLQREGALRKASNLPFIIDTLANHLFPARMWDGIVVLALAALVVVAARAMQSAVPAARLRVLTFSAVALTVALLMLSKKSWPTYLMLVLFPLCLVLARLAPWKRIVFLLFSLVVISEHSFWTIRLGEVDALGLHTLLFAGNRAAVEFLLLELLLIAGYIWLLFESIRQTSRASRDAFEDEDGITSARSLAA